MTILISSSKDEKLFEDKDMINIGTNPSCDFNIDLDFDLLLTIQCNEDEAKCILMNTLHNDKVFFKGQLFKKIEIGNVCKLLFQDSNEFISIKIIEDTKTTKTVSAIEKENLTEEDIKRLYGEDVNAATKIKLEKQKDDIEKDRVSIIKQVSFTIADLKNKIASNFKTNTFMHIAMFFSAIICAFGVSNYLMGLSIKESANYLHLPTNLKVWIAYSVLIYGICLLLKQAIYLYLSNQNEKSASAPSKTAQNLMFGMSTIFIIGIYAINLIYYMNVKNFMAFAILISLFFCGILASLAIGCGYFKFSAEDWACKLNKFEYREDFESVTKSYTQWIERYVNGLSKTKISNIKDRMFNLQLKSVGEIIIGILTAPFLAYGVSNTLAMCFPEAAGWVRISGLRFSPVFLVLATFLIIFAFFSFVNAFLTTKKIQGSEVIKQDGFTDYRMHGVNIYGLEGVRKLSSERTRSMVIACIIIFIEFTMNVSYFMTEIGGDFQGMFLSLVAALVPTALLLAETLMLSQTKFDIYACDELISKLDKD